MLGEPCIYFFSSTRLINSIKQEHSCRILYLYDLVSFKALLGLVGKAMYLRGTGERIPNLTGTRKNTLCSREYKKTLLFIFLGIRGISQFVSREQIPSLSWEGLFITYLGQLLIKTFSCSFQNVHCRCESGELKVLQWRQYMH